MGDDIFLKGLGVMDLLASVITLLLHYEIHLVGWKIGLLCASYLIFKGVFFRTNIISLIDIIAGMYIVILFIFSIKTIASFIIAFYLFQKAVLSLA